MAPGPALFSWAVPKALVGTLLEPEAARTRCTLRGPDIGAGPAAFMRSLSIRGQRTLRAASQSQEIPEGQLSQSRGVIHDGQSSSSDWVLSGVLGLGQPLASGACQTFSVTVPTKWRDSACTGLTVCVPPELPVAYDLRLGVLCRGDDAHGCATL